MSICTHNNDNKTKMYLFFVRHFNDIDHITPIAWRMKKDNYPVAVYSMNPQYDVWKDYRLAFLADQGVTVNYIHDAFHRRGGPVHEFMHSLSQWGFGVQRRSELRDSAQDGIRSGLWGRLAGNLGTLAYHVARKRYYDRGWARSILERTGARAICFDHVMPGLYVVDALLRASKEMSVPALSLPHGIFLYTNEASKPKSTDSRRFDKFNRFDYIIVPNGLRKEVLVRSGVSREKIVVLGSARYCDEWLQQNNKILPRIIESDFGSRARLKVVLMMSKPQCRVDMQRLSRTCAILSDFRDIEALVKPHTRTSKDKNLLDDIQLPTVPHVLTAELCGWADAVLVVGSSVITEALMTGKPALYLKYLHGNTTLFEELGACWTIHDEAELKDALVSLQENKALVPYGDEQVDRFLSETVYGEGLNRDVLSEYEKFIAGCASN